MEQKRTVEALKALADEVRLGIVKKLARSSEPIAGCDIVASCANLHALSQPAVSHHFSKLVDAGIVREEKRGTQKAYVLDRTFLGSIGVDVTKL